MESVKLRIGQLAEEVGVAASALRYYEQEGLLGAGERTQSGYRSYGPEAVGRVQFIKRAKALGLSLLEIRKLVDGRSTPDAEREAVRHLVAHRIAATQARITELQTLNGELESLYVRLLKQPAAECGHVGDCACWLPDTEEVRKMAEEVACCGTRCCPECACTQGHACDCDACPCGQ